MTVRRNWMFAAMALATAFSTTGCAAVVVGSAFPAGSSSPQNRYGFEMSEADHYLADSAAFVRSLDPCGFLTEDDLTALGTVVQLRPDGELSTCTAELITGQSTVTDSVTINLDAYAPDPDDPDIEEVTIGGRQVYVNNLSTSSCNITFPLREVFDGADSGIMDGFRTKSGRSYARIEVYRPYEDACPAATPFAQSALGLLDDPPLRADSKYNLPLATKDPCGVLEHLPATWTVDRWSPDSDPYGCTFTASSASLDENLVMLDVSLEYVSGDTRAKDTDTVRQGDYSVYTRELASTCTADIEVGNPVLGMPEIDDSAARDARTVPTVSVMADGCESAIALAVAAADELTG
ncbi:hypothetical protein ACIGGF_18755 [Rhodococcus sp. NPDC078407]|uniref:hypothetical protein n=1 Tax=Rhodococcus sp. NPDC078407 TaxID=3364509 RepID=UPI0037C8E68F